MNEWQILANVQPVLSGRRWVEFQVPKTSDIRVRLQTDSYLSDVTPFALKSFAAMQQALLHEGLLRRERRERRQREAARCVTVAVAAVDESTAAALIDEAAAVLERERNLRA